MNNAPQSSEPIKLRDRTVSFNGQKVYIKPDNKYKGAVLDVPTSTVYLSKEAENDISRVFE